LKKALFSIDKGESMNYYTDEALLHALSVSVLAERYQKEVFTPRIEIRFFGRTSCSVATVPLCCLLRWKRSTDRNGLDFIAL